MAILETQGIPFAVTGGLAANSYGSARALYDIDLDIPDACFPTLVPWVAPHILFGPARYRDAEFDLLLLTLRYAGQDVDLSGADSGRIRDRRSGDWRDCPSALAGAERRNVLGLVVPVISRTELLSYKRIVARETDLADIAAIQNRNEPNQA